MEDLAGVVRQQLATQFSVQQPGALFLVDLASVGVDDPLVSHVILAYAPQPLGARLWLGFGLTILGQGFWGAPRHNVTVVRPASQPCRASLPWDLTFSVSKHLPHHLLKTFLKDQKNQALCDTFSGRLFFSGTTMGLTRDASLARASWRPHRAFPSNL